jgi:catechol 2,3-dioxygenase-like lactoylglutathione lyase family enzyme
MKPPEPAATVRFGAATPILRIFDIRKAREFYIDYLGYRVDWEHRFEPELPIYMQISRDGSTLHLSEHHGDGSPGVRVRIATEGVECLLRELHAKQYNYMRPDVETAPWGERYLGVIDPFGNRLTFWEPDESTS